MQLGLIRSKMTALYVKSLEDSGFKVEKSQRISSEYADETTIDVSRYFCDDGLLLIPQYRKGSALNKVGSIVGLTAAAAGGFVTVAALAPIYAALAVKNKFVEKSQLTTIAGILSYCEKKPSDVIIIPSELTTKIIVEKPKFDIWTMSMGDIKVWLEGRCIVFGKYADADQLFWIEQDMKPDILRVTGSKSGFSSR